MIEDWRRVWRDAVAPWMSRAELAALRDALAADSPQLIQGATTSPPPMTSVQDWPVESACLLGYAGWKGLGLVTVAEVEEYFARTCYEIDQRVGEPAGCRHLLNWFDEAPRDEMRRGMLAEVVLALAGRPKGEPS